MPPSPTATVQDRVEQDIALLIQSLNLQSLNLSPQPAAGNPGIGSNVIVQMVPDELNVAAFPAVLISSFGERARDEGSTFEQRCTVYPIRVMVLDAAQPSFQSRRSDYEYWLHEIAATLEGLVNHPIFTDAPECWTVDVEDLLSIDPRLPESQWFRGGLVALCSVSEARRRGP